MSATIRSRRKQENANTSATAVSSNRNTGGNDDVAAADDDDVNDGCADVHGAGGDVGMSAPKVPVESIGGAQSSSLCPKCHLRACADTWKLRDAQEQNDEVQDESEEDQEDEIETQSDVKTSFPHWYLIANKCLDPFPRVDPYHYSLFRICVALLILWYQVDFVWNYDLRHFFATNGPAAMFPSTPFLANNRLYRWSLLDAIRAEEFLYIYWYASIAIIILFVFGAFTKYTTPMAFVIIVSMVESSNDIFSAGGAVLRVMTFWTLFSPVGQTLSLDEFWNTKKRLLNNKLVSSLPLHCARLTFISVYWVSGLYKCLGKSWTTEGSALKLVLHQSHMETRANDFVKFLWPFDRVNTFLTISTLGFELALPLILYCPIPRLFVPMRILGILSGIALHCGIYATMQVGPFSLIMIAGYILFIDPKWTCIQIAIEKVQRIIDMTATFLHTICQWFDEKADTQSSRGAVSGGIRKTGDESRHNSLPQRKLKDRHLYMRVVRKFVYHFLILFAFVGGFWISLPNDFYGVQLRSLMPQSYRLFINSIEYWQHWDMFGPEPFRNDIQLYAVGDLLNGTVVDPLRDLPLSGLPWGSTGPFPPAELLQWKYYHHYKLQVNILNFDEEQFLFLGRWICRMWNELHPLELHFRPLSPQDLDAGKLISYKIFERIRRIRIEPGTYGYDESKDHLLWEHHCF